MYRSSLSSQPVTAPLQGGAALLILLTIITLSIATFLLTATSRVQSVLDRPFQNLFALSQAKQALLAYSRLSDPDLSAATGLQLRYLPCPDTDGDGLEESPCGSTSAEGWLPWMSLGLPPLRDASGTCLRYFISSSYKQGSATAPSINPALPVGDFTLSNASQVIATGVVAVVVAPGQTIQGQSRGLASGSATECGSSSVSSAINLAVNYMDLFATINNAVPPGFISAPLKMDTVDRFNDTLLVILASDL